MVSVTARLRHGDRHHFTADIDLALIAYFSYHDGVELKKKVGIIIAIVLFAAYFFLAARPIPLETVLVPSWLTSVESGEPEALNGRMPDEADANAPAPQIPFTLGSRFGYVSRDGYFSVNQVKKANVSLSPQRWAEYEAEPERIAIYDNAGEAVSVIESPRGYPLFFDEKTFLISSEQNMISAIDPSGEVSWTYEFASLITCAASASGLVLTGSLDGTASLLDSRGRQVFSFEPGGSRYSVIYGCAISRDGSRLALISGFEDQRFLMLERFGNNSGDYKVVYHEFLGRGFIRPVYISFIEDDRWVVFERSGGLGFYEISSRQTGRVELNGTLSAIDHSGGQGMIFVVISRADDAKYLAGIKLPGKIIIESPFKSEDVFLGKIDSRLIVGGGQILAAFDLEKK